MCRKLDALIAEKVMGWTRIEWVHNPHREPEPKGTSPDEKHSCYLTFDQRSSVPYYSTNYIAAIELRNTIVADDPLLAGLFAYNIVEQVKKHHGRTIGDSEVHAILHVEPIHICNAALETFGIEFKSSGLASEASKPHPQAHI